MMTRLNINPGEADSNVSSDRLLYDKGSSGAELGAKKAIDKMIMSSSDMEPFGSK